MLVWQDRRRRAAMRAVAEQLGLDFVGDPNAIATEHVAQLRAIADVPLFSRGCMPWGANDMTGWYHGRTVRVCDFGFKYRKGSRSSTKVTVVLVPDGGAGLPDFVLAPASVFGMRDGYSGQEVGLPGPSGFSRHYVVRGTDEAATRRAFTSEALEFFAHEAGWHIEVAKGHLLSYRDTKTISPRKVPNLVDGTLRIVELLAPKQ